MDRMTLHYNLPMKDHSWLVIEAIDRDIPLSRLVDELLTEAESLIEQRFIPGLDSAGANLLPRWKRGEGKAKKYTTTTLSSDVYALLIRLAGEAELAVPGRRMPLAYALSNLLWQMVSYHRAGARAAGNPD